VNLLELTSAYAAVASGRYPIRARGLPADEEAGGFSGLLQGGGRMDNRRDWAPMLDLLYAAANNGTGRRAALAVPTFGKTGTSQDNRDALFVGFAGNLVVGVWVGRDDDKPLGRNVSGGTVPAQIWHNFMVSAVAVDGRAGPPLPGEFKIPEQVRPRKERESPLPEEWSKGAEPLRKVLREIEKLFE
jgi:penicillin-binding protein 1A